MIGDSLMIKVNLLGFSAFFSYVTFFYLMSHEKLLLMKKFFIIIIALFGTFYIILVTNDPNFWSGIVAIASSLIFIMSPLASIGEVIKSRSTAMLPFWMILFNFVVCSLWTLQGYLTNTYFLVVPNIIGSSVSFIQLSLFIVYPSKNIKVKPKRFIQ